MDVGHGILELFCSGASSMYLPSRHRRVKRSQRLTEKTETMATVPPRTEPIINYELMWKE